MDGSFDLSAVAAEMAALRERMAEMEAELASFRGSPPAGREPTGTTEADQSIDRRAALRRAGMLAAGAVAGGAGLVAVAATPAAAATVTGSGNPGVVAQGIGGDGVSASADSANKSAVYANSTNLGGYGVFASNGAGGQALQASASPTAASGKVVASVDNDGDGPALRAVGNPAVTATSTTGDAVRATSTSGPAIAASTASTGEPAVYAENTGGGTGLLAEGGRGLWARGFSADGVYATSNGATSSGVSAASSQAGGVGVRAENSAGGTALVAQSNGTGATVRVTNTSISGAGLQVQGGGRAATFDGRVDIDAESGTVLQVITSAEAAAFTGTVRITKSLGAGTTPFDALFVEADGVAATGISVRSDVGAGPTSIGFRTSGFATGADVEAKTVGLRVRGGSVTARLVPASVTNPPGRAGAYETGDLVSDGTDLWFCTQSGSPGTWRKLAGRATAGAFHVLPAPARVYDSRPGTSPAINPKTPLSANTPRPLDLRVNDSGVPAGATAALVTLLLVNAAAGNGNLTIWANGVAKPLANTMVWGGSTGRFTATAVTALDPNARIQVQASLATDLVLDVVGYYR